MRARYPTSVWIAKRKRAGGGYTYRIRWKDRSGRWQSEACGDDRKYAKVRQAQKCEELRNGALDIIPHTSLSVLIEKLPTFMAGKARDTIKKTQRSLQYLDELCGPLALSDINRAAIIEYRAKRLSAGRAPATVAKDLREIKSALSYAVDAGLLKANPLLRFKNLFPKEPERKIRVVEPAEYAALLAACRLPEFRALVTVAYRQGLRRNEMANLRWLGPHGEPMVDFEAGVLHVINRADKGELTKSRKNRSIPLHPEASEALRVLWEQTPKRVEAGRQVPKFEHVFTTLEGRRLHHSLISQEFQRTMKRAGIARATIHDLRRSFSTRAQRLGVDIETVTALGGWSNTEVVKKHYTGNVDEALHAAMKRIAEAG